MRQGPAPALPPGAPGPGTSGPGGGRAWLVWALPTVLFVAGFFHRVAPGVIAKELMETFGVPGGVVGLLSATYFYAYAGLMIPAGLLVDAFGPRRVVTAGGAVMGLGTLAMAGAEATSTLFAGRLVVGLGAAVTFVGALKVAATWFPPFRFGTLAAVTATMGSVGALLGTAPLAQLVARLGWRGAFRLAGALILLAAGLCALVVRDRPPGRDGERRPPPVGGSLLVGLLRVLGNRHTWPPFFAFFCLYAASSNLALWIVPALHDVYRLPAPVGARFAMAPSLVLLLAGPLTGVVSDRVLRRRKLPYTVLSAALATCWAVLALGFGRLSPGAVLGLLAAMGLAGAGFVLTWPIGREVNPPELAGVAVATVNLGGFLGAALTQGFLGAVLDAGWAGETLAGARVYPVRAYRAAFGACAGLVGLATLVTLAMRETLGRNVYAELRGPAPRPSVPPR